LGLVSELDRVSLAIVTDEIGVDLGALVVGTELRVVLGTDTS
jgi:hypothetical protein